MNLIHLAAPRFTPPAWASALHPFGRLDMSESKCVSRAPVEGQGKASIYSCIHSFIQAFGPPPPPPMPGHRHQISSTRSLLHLHLLRSNTQESSLIPPSFSHIPPRPSHPTANPVGSTLNFNQNATAFHHFPCS